MPLDQPDPREPFRLKVCTSCKKNKHHRCGPLWDDVHGRVLYCECPGWDDPEHNKVLALLPCLPRPSEENP